jgi:hypothetical protein
MYCPFCKSSVELEDKHHPTVGFERFEAECFECGKIVEITFEREEVEIPVKKVSTGVYVTEEE